MILCNSTKYYGVACRALHYGVLYSCTCRVLLKKVKKVKEVDLYSAFIEVPHTQGVQVQITQCYLQITPYLPLLLQDNICTVYTY